MAGLFTEELSCIHTHAKIVSSAVPCQLNVLLNELGYDGVAREGSALQYLDKCLTRRTSCGFRAPRSPQVKKSNSVHSIYPCKMSSDERKSRNKPTSTQKTIKKSCWTHQEKSYDLMDSRSIKKKKPRICQSNLIGYCVVRA